MKYSLSYFIYCITEIFSVPKLSQAPKHMKCVDKFVYLCPSPSHFSLKSTCLCFSLGIERHAQEPRITYFLQVQLLCNVRMRLCHCCVMSSNFILSHER